MKSFRDPYGDSQIKGCTHTCTQTCTAVKHDGGSMMLLVAPPLGI